MDSKIHFYLGLMGEAIAINRNFFKTRKVENGPPQEQAKPSKHQGILP